MKHLEVKRLDCQQVKAAEVPALFKTKKVEYHKIDTVDWEADYPYCPHVEFAIAHKGDAIMIHYRVEEDSVRAVSGNDLGPVWEDSCCEFFVSPAQLGRIDRWASLGRTPFDTKNGAQAWELSLVIPVSSFFRYHIVDLSGLQMRANFYKCGDKTSRPHFLSWNPIDVPSPDFHRPDFFGQLAFL